MSKFRNSEYINNKNISFFDRWAATYDKGRISNWFNYTQSLAISCLKLKPNARVLDVGCGTGNAVIELASILSEGKAYGIDISSVMIEKARAKITPDLRGKIEFHQASSDKIPLSNETFNHIICTNSFHHYVNPINSLKELLRLLKPGGQLVILENAIDLSLYTRIWDLLLRLFEKGHIRYYGSDELGEMIKKSGFEKVELCYLKNERFKHGKIFASLQVWSGRAPSKPLEK